VSRSWDVAPLILMGVALGLLDVLGQPLLTTTLQLPGDELPLNDGEHIRERLDSLIDFVLDAPSLSDTDKAAILGGNASRLLRI
jgi:tRNA A37 threonylcarbamoyladenosine synthetase subunit TsaC/SUA5/YrdC